MKENVRRKKGLEAMKNASAAGTKTLVLLVLLTVFHGVAQAYQPESVMWYRQPAGEWHEALPVGNGRLGAMVYGGYPQEIIQLNEESLWAGSKSEANADAAARMPEIQQLLIDGDISRAADLSETYLKSDPMWIRSYQSFGELKLDFFDRGAPEAKNYRRELNLETGVASTVYEAGNTRYERELFISAPDNVLALRLTAVGTDKLTFRLSYAREQDATAYPASANELEIKGQIVDLPVVDAGENGLHMKFAGRIRGVNRGGRLTAVNNSFFVENADEVVFFLTAATDYNFEKLDTDRSIDPSSVCKGILDKVDARNYAAVRQRHIAEHGALMNRLHFTLGKDGPGNIPVDERLQRVKDGATDLALVALYFQYGRYLLVNSSRAPGVLPANLQGIWCKDMQAAWSSDFHTNINIQMNYWPAEICNLPETVIPFSRMIDALRTPGRVTAQKTYNAKGWTMNHLTDPFGRTAISDGVGWGTFPIASSWLVLHQWEHYLFTGDEAYLRNEAYPCMKEAAEFILSYMVKDKNGHWVTAPSNSPENAYILDGRQYKFTYAATVDIEIITELFRACLQAEKVLKQDKPFGKQLESALKKLPPIRISERYHTIQEWIEDYEEVEPGHRHISHLFGLHPGTTITSATPVLFEGAKKTLERRLSNGGGHTGWSRAWVINFYARLLDGENAGNHVQALLAKSTLNNLFDTHPPFQIDGNFGGTAGIAEMLLQSHNGELHLLPALPSGWQEGEITGLRARGGWIVDLKWEKGVLTSARIFSKEGGKCKIHYKERTGTVSVKAGEEYVYPEG
ncbi:MAG: glycoside hydrolase family 95 protein [Tannerella sp.]|jgi:alpha-L-fucosidase 2|nr:glycoside hydrolase family 95 protein [Tannerella sp.]